MNDKLHTLLYALIGVIDELDVDSNWRGETNAQWLYRLLDDIECTEPKELKEVTK